MIDSFGFGFMVIDGRRYSSDLIIYPGGRIQDGWRRRRGHVLTRKDLETLVETWPKVIIAGKGINGGMLPEPGLEETLGNLGIQFMAASNDQAAAWYNDRSARLKAGACFHLTC
ncbi:MAG: hypothetical protein JRE21_06170 [Deltaproteobacteria bacterium]|nr:hypothetical protein [Deltaproteobacteria bacterium]